MTASFIDCGGTVCDVGCDHGKLTVYLLSSGKARRVIATDIREGPLCRAKDLVGRWGLSDKVWFLLADGLSRVCPDKISPPLTHIVIAGMGGVTMANIIDSAPFLRSDKIYLVLQPAQRGYCIRQYLRDSGFRILTEKAVEEHGKFYTCILSVWDGLKRDISPGEIFFGNILSESTPRASGYIAMVREKLLKMRLGRDNGGSFSASVIDRALREADSRVK